VIIIPVLGCYNAAPSYGIARNEDQPHKTESDCRHREVYKSQMHRLYSERHKLADKKQICPCSIFRVFLPVHGDGSHRVYWWKHGSDGEEVLKSAVTQAKIPVVVKRIDKVKKSVRGCHGYIRKGQVDDKVIGYGPHASVSKDNPDYCDIPSDGHQDDERVGYSPESHLREEGRGEVRW